MRDRWHSCPAPNTQFARLNQSILPGGNEPADAGQRSKDTAHSIKEVVASDVETATTAGDDALGSDENGRQPGRKREHGVHATHERPKLHIGSAANFFGEELRRRRSGLGQEQSVASLPVSARLTL